MIKNVNEKNAPNLLKENNNVLKDNSNVNKNEYN